MLERDIFADNVRRLREERGWTQEQLADAADMTLDHVSKIENYRREPRVRTIAKLARGLDVTAGPLFEGLDID